MRAWSPINILPYFVRIDRNIDFDSIVALGSLPGPSYVRWDGHLYAPISGTYRFLIDADDDGWLSIDGTPVIHDPGPIYKATDEGTMVLQAGWHKIEAGQRNIWGDAEIHMHWQPPGGEESPIPDDYLSPVENKSG